jgi:hypothetical protein
MGEGGERVTRAEAVLDNPEFATAQQWWASRRGRCVVNCDVVTGSSPVYGTGRCGFFSENRGAGAGPSEIADDQLNESAPAGPGL